MLYGTSTDTDTRQTGNVEDLSFCASFKTDTGYTEGSRALTFLRIFVYYIGMQSFYTHIHTCSRYGMRDGAFSTVSSF